MPIPTSLVPPQGEADLSSSFSSPSTPSSQPPRARRPLNSRSSGSSTTINELNDPSGLDLSTITSNWGEEISVPPPRDVHDPLFLELQRALTGASKHEDQDWFEKHLRHHKKNDQGLPVDKRLDVAWHSLSVRGEGKDEIVSSKSSPLSPRRFGFGGRSPAPYFGIPVVASAAIASQPSLTNSSFSSFSYLRSLLTTWAGESFGFRPFRPRGTRVVVEADPFPFSFTSPSLLNPFTKLRDARRAKASHAAVAETSSKEEEGLGKTQKFLLRNFNGVLRSGEMALVVGRPGSGCTTFLKTITNNRDGFAGVDGDVHYGAMSAKEAKKYPGQIIFNAEDDTHYPVLTVAQTLEFALKMKTPRIRHDGQSKSQYEAAYLDVLLKTFGLEHARETVVGNENV